MHDYTGDEYDHHQREQFDKVTIFSKYGTWRGLRYNILITKRDFVWVEVDWKDNNFDLDWISPPLFLIAYIGITWPTPDAAVIYLHFAHLWNLRICVNKRYWVVKKSLSVKEKAQAFVSNLMYFR